MSNAEKIQFGTDGIRGPFGIFPLTTPALQQIAQGIAHFLNSNASVAIARDTRASGIEIFEILSETLIEYGLTVYDCGILPTAALACLVADEMDLGLVITASHNPASDNGIKIFNSKGEKLSKANQQRLESLIGHPPHPTQGSIKKHPNPCASWKKRLPTPNLQEWTILIDCANGALSPFAQEILEKLGAKVLSIGATPNGQNINDGVGSLYPPTDLQGADIALCFDGDADRLIPILPTVGILDGDDYLWLMRNAIKGPLVGTIMSNGGLNEALEHRLLRSAVGDQHVATLMSASNAVLGAEPSGHIIFADGEMPAGDGLYAALRLLEIIHPQQKLEWTRWPSAQSSVKFQCSKEECPSINSLQSVFDAEKSGHRLVVRYSGTEAKLRILVEGQEAEKWCTAIQTEFMAALPK